MRFIVDECTGPAVARWLRTEVHDVFSVYEEARGIADAEIIRLANADNRILITNDRDFGEKIFRERAPHHGIIFLRLEDERFQNKIAVIEKLLENHGDELANRFVVVTERRVRFASR